MNELQFGKDGRLRHLITLDGFDRARIHALLDRADAMRADSRGGARSLDLLAGRTLINLFFEPSTRTRTSFDLAAKRLGAQVINFDIARSSTVKGESLLDTIHTLEAMHCDAFVVRHQETGTPELVARHLRSAAAVLNAGDGSHAHPTQGLLDALTIRRHCGDLAALRVVICGDIRHSRVARSDVHALRALGIGELRLCAPPSLLPADDSAEFPQCRFFHNFDEAIDRLRRCDHAAAAEGAHGPRRDSVRGRLFRALRTLAHASGAREAGCVVMHPGPINRNVEIADDVADGPQSLILDQVANGVFVRMAVLAELLAP